MKTFLTIALSAASLVYAAAGAEAYTRHPSTPAERAQTKALNQQQLQLAQEENAGSANATANASAGMAANSTPAAVPNSSGQQADANAMSSGPASGP